MIFTLENQDGFVTAFIEWDVLDHRGQFDNNGDYICIREAWIHKSIRRSDALGELSLKIYNGPENTLNKDAEIICKAATLEELLNVLPRKLTGADLIIHWYDEQYFICYQRYEQRALICLQHIDPKQAAYKMIVWGIENKRFTV